MTPIDTRSVNVLRLPNPWFRKNHKYILYPSECIFPSGFWGSDHNHANYLRKQNNSTAPQNSKPSDCWRGVDWPILKRSNSCSSTSHVIMCSSLLSQCNVYFVALDWLLYHVFIMCCVMQFYLFIYLSIFQANGYYVTEPPQLFLEHSMLTAILRAFLSYKKSQPSNLLITTVMFRTVASSWMLCTYNTPWRTVQLHISGLIGTASHPVNHRKSGQLDFPFKIGWIGSLMFGCYYLQ
jgi:hypothetical protein